MIGTRSSLAALGAVALLLGGGCSAVDSATGDDPPASPTPASNGVADKAPAEILSAARTALAGAGSVHVKGNGTEDGQVYALDMRIKGTAGGRGTVTISHNPVEVVRIGKVSYFKGGAKFWLDFGADPAAAELLKGKYFKGRASDANLKGLLAFTDAADLGDELLKADGVVTKADRRTVAGVETIGVTFVSQGDETTVYVATTGKAYPMYLSTTGETPDKTSALDFTDYDKPFDLKPPPADLVVDPDTLDGS